MALQGSKPKDYITLDNLETKEETMLKKKAENNERLV